MAPPTEITLGPVTVSVVPQRIGYLENRIGPVITGVIARGESLTTEAILPATKEAAYDLLCALIPNLDKRLPKWQFCAYGSAEAMDAGEYDEAVDESPTLPEIFDAFETALRVSGVTRGAELLGKAGIRELAAAQLRLAIVTSVESPSLLSPNGESESTSSGTTPRTSTKKRASRSPVSPA
jgi:hypothetical protein